jgi:hypothetical protein
MILFLLFACMIILLIHFTNRRYSYECFLLTLENETERRKRFLTSHKKDVPIDIIYGIDTRIVNNARKFEDRVDPEYFEKAVEMHYDPKVKRPDITYFNIGAIGCFMGHMEFYKRCFRKGIKYAVIFEDNVVVKSDILYDKIQEFIDEKGDNFEMCFFHSLSRLPNQEDEERVDWISSTKCYLVHVNNMRKYIKYFYPMDNHIDMKHEDIISRGARVYYRDMRYYMYIDRSHKSIIGHVEHGRPSFFSRQHRLATTDDLIIGY